MCAVEVSSPTASHRRCPASPCLGCCGLWGVSGVAAPCDRCAGDKLKDVTPAFMPVAYVAMWDSNERVCGAEAGAGHCVVATVACTGGGGVRGQKTLFWTENRPPISGTVDALRFFPDNKFADVGGGAQSSIRRLLGAADAQTAHPAIFSTAPAPQPLGSANAETTPARAPAAAADRTQRPDATCEGENG